MDINRVELKGRIGSDIVFRKAKNGNEWAAFYLVVNEYNPHAKLEKDKSVPTWISIAVFNSMIVKRIKYLKLRQGESVWLNGKIYVNMVEKKGDTYPYTSIVVSELEAIKNSKKHKEKELEMMPLAQCNDEQPF